MSPDRTRRVFSVDRCHNSLAALAKNSRIISVIVLASATGVMGPFTYWKSRSTPVSDAKTITEILWLLPSRAAKELWHRSTENTRRVLSEDTSIYEMSKCLPAQFWGEAWLLMKLKQAFAWRAVRSHSVVSYVGNGLILAWYTFSLWIRNKGLGKKRLVKSRIVYLWL